MHEAATERDPWEAYNTLARIVREWYGTGRKAMAAGLKPELQRQIDGFAEADYGFERFADFIDAAVEAGVVRLDPAGAPHRCVLPVDAVSPGDPETRPAEISQTQRRMRRARLRPDVWSSFVEWYDDHIRLWDRQTQRPFVFPVDANGSPAWLDPNDATRRRFVELPAVSREQQVEWMRQWSEVQDEPARDHLLAALEPTAVPGQFRRTLGDLGLALQWRNELGARVGEVVAEWAGVHGIAASALVDPRDRSGRTTQRTQASNSGEPAMEAKSEARVSSGEQLRALVHAAVDQMSVSELASLQIRAEYLLLAR